jgi:hypothetical protein
MGNYGEMQEQDGDIKGEGWREFKLEALHISLKP